MHSSDARPHVLIVGGGIGGLCLAQGLRRSGIGVEVFERDPCAQVNGQGYRISIKQEGSQALRDCLPADRYQLCVATALRTATRMVFLDHQLHEKFSRPIPPLPGDRFFGVNRLTLREILLAGLEEVVRFGKSFERFEQCGDGRVRAWFADGTSATGELLVGADGTGSAVRPLLVPDASFDDLGAFVYGRTTIVPGTLERVPAVLIDSFNRMTAPDGVAMSVATCRGREPLAAATARLAPSLRLSAVPDYLAWMLDGGPAGNRVAGARAAGDGRALQRLAVRMLAGWPAEVCRIVEAADADASFLVWLRSARPVRPWCSPNVTLLGDAVHTMSPGRGEGANTALHDARLLRHELVRVAHHGVPLPAAKAAYEAEMLRHGFQAVADSLRRPFAPRPGRPT
jgi:2-polyprenyl-6-methoxyphenol hydroxylase-like FAD-dependent oxidoreductase